MRRTADMYSKELMSVPYIVYESMLEKEDRQQKRLVMPAVAISSGSEFMEACSQADPVKMWSVLDETMQAVKTLQPRLYEAVLRKLKE